LRITHCQKKNCYLLKSQLVGFVMPVELVHVGDLVANGNNFRGQNPERRILASGIEFVEMERNGMVPSWVVNVNTNNFSIVNTIVNLGKVSVFATFNPVVHNSVVNFSLSNKTSVVEVRVGESAVSFSDVTKDQTRLMNNEPLLFKNSVQKSLRPI